MLSKELENTLNETFRTARARRHEFITVQHLLLALLDDSAAVAVLEACQVDLDDLRGELTEFIDSTTPLLSDSDDGRDTQPTLGFQRVLQRAVFHVQSSGQQEVTGANLLVAIFSEQESQAVYFLKSQNVSRLDVVNFITHGIGKDGRKRPMAQSRSGIQRRITRVPRSGRSMPMRPTSTPRPRPVISTR